MENIAEHVRYPTGMGTPGQFLQGRGIGPKEQIGADKTAKAWNCGGVKRNSVRKGAWKLVLHHSDVVLPPIDVAKGHSDEFHILFFDILYDFLLRVFHTVPAPFRICILHPSPSGGGLLLK